MLEAVRWHHIAAMFGGVVFWKYALWSDPQMADPGPAWTVVLACLIFGLLWECIIRLSRLIFQGRLTRE